MKTSNYWLAHFRASAGQKRINWNLKPCITGAEVELIKTSLQAWQLAETSEGWHLIKAAQKYATKFGDADYVDAIKLFIKEEQKHGENLGMYLDAIGIPRVKKSWDDTIFREVRHFNTNMELWTIAVLVVESTAQIFYQSLKDATQCELLKDICRDILIDEAHHITFQTERLAIIYDAKSTFSKTWRTPAYKCFFYATSLLVWIGHRKLFKAGGNSLKSYLRKMEYKYAKTLMMITNPMEMEVA